MNKQFMFLICLVTVILFVITSTMLTPSPNSRSSAPTCSTEVKGGNRRRVAVLTMFVEGARDWIHPLSFRNKLAYCQEHGIDLIVEGTALVDTTRDVCWSKIPMLKEWLPHYDWIMWMDGDAFFMNHRIKIDSILDDAYDFIVAKDWNDINLGMFFIRNSKYSFELLDEMWNVPKQYWNPFQEQGALHYLTDPRKCPKGEYHLQHFRFPPQRMFNSYPEHFAYGNKESLFQPGDWIAHFPNCKGRENCKETMTAYSQRAKSVTIADADIPNVYFPKWSKRTK
eukprot:PhF_6_TR3387/c0_g1_i1/m.4845